VTVQVLATSIDRERLPSSGSALLELANRDRWKYGYAGDVTHLRAL